MKKVIFKVSQLCCAFALFVAMNSLDILCQSRYYQPEVPESLNKYRKN